MNRNLLLNKLLSIFASFSMLIQTGLPFLFITPAKAFAQDSSATPTETIVPTIVPTSTVVPTPTTVETALGGELTTMVIPDKSADSIDNLNLDPQTVVSNPNIITDKADYAPTDAVVITGTGFTPSTIYTIYITADSFSFTDSLTTDEKGGFVYTYQLDGTYRPNYTVQIKDENVVVAETSFTDSGYALDQCRNGAFTNVANYITNLGIPCGTTSNQQFQNGNVGGSNSAYREGDGLPYRFIITGLDPGEHTVTLEYEFTKNGVYAIDRLTAPSLTQQQNDCGTSDGQPAFSTCNLISTPSPDMPGEVATTNETHPALINSGNLSTFTGLDHMTVGYLNNITDSRKMTAGVSSGESFIWGTFDTNVVQSGLSTGDSSRSFSFKFTLGGCSTGSCNVVFSWTGHIASAVDWGVGKGASSISGSPFHMYIVGVDGTGGAQNRSVQLGAILIPSTVAIHKVTDPSGGNGFGYTTTGGLTPSVFSLNDGGTQTYSPLPGTYTVTENDPSPTYGLTGLSCSASGQGASQSTNLTTRTAAFTIGTNGGATIDCTYTNSLQQGTLTVIKHVINEDGGTKTAADFNLHVKSDGSDVSGSPVAGSETGTDYTLAEGTYVVSEDTPPTGYTQTGFSGDCDSGGNVTVVAGQTKTCTITNDDITPTLKLVKNVIKDDGGTAVADNWTLYAAATSPDDARNFSNTGGSGTFQNVFANAGYVLSETSVSGYSEGSWNCDGGSLVGSTITLDLNEDVTCTITNDDIAPTLKLVKDVTNDNGGSKTPGDWDLTASGSVLGFTDKGDSTTFHTVKAGVSYTLTESAVSGYTMGTWSCTGGGSLTDNVVTLGLDEDVTCTISNDDQTGHLKIIKNTLGGNDTFNFNVTGPTPLTPSILTSGNYGNTGLIPVNAGNYSVTESVPSGWDLTGSSCDFGTPTGFTVLNGETITCTFTDTKRGHIIIVKDAVPNNTQDFTFHDDFGNGNPESFLLDDDSNATLPKQRDFEVLPGTYSVSEDAVTGWKSPKTTSCDDGSPVSAIAVSPGETVTCTFTNQELATIILVKNTIGGNGTFDFVMTGTTLPSSAQLITSGNTDSETFNYIDPDNTYTISETVPSGWDLTGSSCTGSNSPDNISPDSGETVTCTFTDTKRGHIIVDKVTNPSAANQSFNFDASGGTDPLYSDFSLTDKATPNDQELKPGTYSVSEDTVTNWTNTGATCDDGSPVNSISLQAGETVTCTFTNTYTPPLTVTKTAETSYTRTFGWSIDKSVTPSAWDLFKGDSGTSEYTVSVTKDSGTDSAWKVEGTISIHNSAAVAAHITGVIDEVSTAIGATVDCGVTIPYDLASGEDLSCTYSVNLLNADTRTNTATVTTTGLVPGGTGDANVTFGAPTTLVNDEINVTDTNGGSWQFNSSGSQTYDKTFNCDADEGKHDNTATILETQQSDDATVTLDCHDLNVSKNADTSFDRTYNWTINKSADKSTVTLSPDEILPVNYEVTVDMPGFDDSNWAVDGTITVHNPAPIDAVINSVDDIVSPDISANVDCGVTFPYSLVAGEDLVCTYDLALPDATSRINTGTATLQNYSFDHVLDATEDGTTDFSGDTSIDFSSANINEIDECIDVNDSLQGNLDTVCYGTDTFPKTFSYTRNVGPYTAEDCGIPQKVENTAEFVTNDTETTGEDNWTVDITVACVCSLTQGYWKTHNDSFAGGAPTDNTWNKITPFAQLSGFFTTSNSFPALGPNDPSLTWFKVFWTSPQGNVYYNLAHQYMAAKLNILNGATSTPVASAIASAETLFKAYTPTQIGALKNKPSDKVLRQQFINLAGILGAFNEGLTNPAGHCSE